MKAAAGILAIAAFLAAPPAAPAAAVPSPPGPPGGAAVPSPPGPPGGAVTALPADPLEGAVTPSPAGQVPAGHTGGQAAHPTDASVATTPAVAPVTGKPERRLRVGLRQCLAVSAVVFGLGVMIIVIRRNAIAVLMGIELILNSAALNFVAFSKYVGKDILDGQVVAIFLIVIAAAEAAVALAIILNIFHNLNTVTVDEADALKG